MLRHLYNKIYQNSNSKPFLRKLMKHYRFFKEGWFYKNIINSITFPFLIEKQIKNFTRFEKMIYSQNGEDGILKAIFTKIGITTHQCIEFGIEANEGNTILLKKQGWNCLWMDGNGDNKSIQREFINAENIEFLFSKYKISKEFDLLSIDIDSNDYWVWKAISNYSPRIIVIEYNASVSLKKSKSTKYDPNYRWDGTNYFGASLLVLKKLGEKKGYTLLTCDSNGVNAFFIRNDLIKDCFLIKNIEDIYKPPNYGIKKNGKCIGHPPSIKKMIDV